MTLEETIKQIEPLNEEMMQIARRRWDSIAKPLHSLGKMEDLITQIVGITGEQDVNIKNGHWWQCVRTMVLWRKA